MLGRYDIIYKILSYTLEALCQVLILLVFFKYYFQYSNSKTVFCILTVIRRGSKLCISDLYQTLQAVSEHHENYQP